MGRATRYSMTQEGVAVDQDKVEREVEATRLKAEAEQQERVTRAANTARLRQEQVDAEAAKRYWRKHWIKAWLRAWFGRV